MDYIAMWKTAAVGKTSDGHTSPYHDTLMAVKKVILTPPPAWVDYDPNTDPEWWLKQLSHERSALDAAIASGDSAMIHEEMLHEAATLVCAVKHLFGSV